MPGSIETLGQAREAGWRVTVRCALGRQVGMKRIRECLHRQELDLDTLVWTRGQDFPLAMLASRLRCPRCGARKVAVAFDVPTVPHRSAAW